MAYHIYIYIFFQFKKILSYRFLETLENSLRVWLITERSISNTSHSLTEHDVTRAAANRDALSAIKLLAQDSSTHRLTLDTHFQKRRDREISVRSLCVSQLSMPFSLENIWSCVLMSFDHFYCKLWILSSLLVLHNIVQLVHWLCAWSL